MKVFISLPMYGRTDTEIRDKQRQILYSFAKEKKIDYYDLAMYEIIDNLSQEKTELTGDDQRLLYCCRSMAKMAEADFVIFSADWSNARGCKLEMNACIMYNKKIFVEDAYHE